MTELISLIIITYNRPDDLLDLLRSLRRQEDIHLLKEVLILNNASTIPYTAVELFIDANPDLKVRYMVSAENLGVSRGRNKLMKMATGELLLVLDDDITFREARDLQLTALAFDNPLFENSNTGVITFRVIYHDTKEMQRTAFPHKKFDSYISLPVFLTSYYAGCAHIIRKEVIEQTGVYPEDFFYGMEEYDLSYRVIKAGYSIGYNSSVTFEHKESPLGRQPNSLKLASQWVNKSKVAWRYLPRLYYFTTMIAWNFEYIKKAGGHWGIYFSSWSKALRICISEKRHPVNKEALAYLKKVRARLWY